MDNPEILRVIADGSKKWQFGPNAIISLVAILIVFCVLALIIGLTVLISKCIKEKKVTNNVKQNTTSSNATKVEFDENNEDMMMAVMVATIDYREETKQDVTLVDIKEIKE